MTASITVDGGGSRCRARLRKDGSSFEATLEEPLNLVSQRLDEVLDRLGRLLGGLPATDSVGLVSVGVAGGVPGRRRDIVEEAIGRRYPGAEVLVRPDLDLVVAQLSGDGVAIVVGTGCAAVVTTSEGENVTVDGHGLGIGDRGGAAWIGLQAVQVGVRRLDLEGVETPLLRAVRENLGLHGDRGFYSALSVEGGLSARRLAALAPAVLTLADQVEPDAGAIVTAAIAEVEATAGAAARATRQTLPTEVVVAGGLISAPGFYPPLRAALLGSGIAARVDRVDPLDAELVTRGHE